MRIKFQTRTDKPVPIVLACDPALVEANKPEILAEYASGLDVSEDIVVPDDACVIKVRALSGMELADAKELVEEKFPGVEVGAAKYFLDKEKDKVDLEGSILTLKRFSLMRIAADLELVEKGVVDIADIDPIGGNYRQYFEPLNDIGIFPLTLRAAMLTELAQHVRTAGELGPLTGQHYNPLFG